VVGRHCVLGGGNHQLVATERATHAVAVAGRSAVL
jgi:hypothetical protein